MLILEVDVHNTGDPFNQLGTLHLLNIHVSATFKNKTHGMTRAEQTRFQQVRSQCTLTALLWPSLLRAKNTSFCFILWSTS